MKHTCDCCSRPFSTRKAFSENEAALCPACLRDLEAISPWDIPARGRSDHERFITSGVVLTRAQREWLANNY